MEKKKYIILNQAWHGSFQSGSLGLAKVAGSQVVYHRASKSIINLFVQLDCQICKVFCLFCFQLTICELCVSEDGADILIGWYLGLK